MVSEIGAGFVDDLTPFPDEIIWEKGTFLRKEASTIDKVVYYALSFFKFCVHFALLFPAAIYSMGRYAISYFSEKKEKTLFFPPAGAEALPEYFGGSASFFQNDGASTRYGDAARWGKSDWYDWLREDNPIIEKVSIDGKPVDFSKIFSKSLEGSEEYIEHVIGALGGNGDRFSVEWSMIEPEPGVRNQEAIDLYRTYIQKLKTRGIEPFGTLHHFVCPKWFSDRGGFLNEENIDLFVDHALFIMEEFPEVKYWIPFNEINVDGFQKYIRGVYPPGDVGAFQKAGISMRNQLVAHVKLFQKVQERQARGEWLDKQIGSTHQWLKFEPLEGNFLENIVCYVLSKMTHFACFNFFKTGIFSFEFPGLANVRLEIPKDIFEKNRGFSHFYGAQFYGFPRIKLGSNEGEAYPGYGIQNFLFSVFKTGLTFGSTCPKGGVVQSFGPSVYPESLDACLEEARGLLREGQKIFITETGCDARVQKFGEKNWTIDQKVQEEYFKKILPILKKHQDILGGVFFWTPVKGLEWERVETPHLHLGIGEKGADGKITKYKMSLAALFLQKVFREKRDQAAAPAA